MDYLQVRELYHWGIKGQKWGIRRYQNEDGSLTEEGRRRYNVGYYDAKDKGEAPQLYAYPEGKGPKGVYYRDANGNEVRYKGNIHDLSDAEVVDMTKRASSEENIQRKLTEGKVTSEQAARATSQLLNDVAKQMPTGNGKIIKKNYSNITDAELRERIGRLKLEDEYGRLTGDTKYVKSGSEKAKEMLQTAGAVVALGGSALVLAKGILSLFPNEDAKNSPVAKKTRKKAATKTASTILLSAPVNHSMQKPQNGNELYHYGVKGQKWGERRFQNLDGTLTAEGKARYYDDLASKEMLNNSSLYNRMGRNHRREYVDYGRKQGAKKGFLTGMLAGATVGGGKTVLDFIKNKNSDDNKDMSVNRKINRFMRNTILGAFGGSVVGTLTGATIGKHKAQADLAKYGKEYAEAVLSLPIDNIKHSDDLTNLELYHFGILGQKWGIRRFQNPDGTLTTEGKARYSKEISNNPEKFINKNIKMDSPEIEKIVIKSAAYSKAVDSMDEYENKIAETDSNYASFANRYKNGFKSDLEFKQAEKLWNDKLNETYNNMMKDPSFSDKKRFYKTTKRELEDALSNVVDKYTDRNSQSGEALANALERYISSNMIFASGKNAAMPGYKYSILAEAEIEKASGDDISKLYGFQFFD